MRSSGGGATTNVDRGATGQLIDKNMRSYRIVPTVRIRPREVRQRCHAADPADVNAGGAAHSGQRRLHPTGRCPHTIG